MIKKVISKIKRNRKKYISKLIRWYNYIYPNRKKFDYGDLKDRESFKDDYRIVAESLCSNISFQSVFDVGCAQGFLLKPLHERGFDVKGIEVSSDVVELLPSDLSSSVTIGDFREANGNYDLVCCVEVAEHIEPARSKELVGKLCTLSNKWVYFTAAPPGQEGHGHINCRPHEHWIQWFEEYGWQVRNKLTSHLREDLDEIERARWLIDNSFILSYQ